MTGQLSIDVRVNSSDFDDVFQHLTVVTVSQQVEVFHRCIRGNLHPHPYQLNLPVQIRCRSNGMERSKKLRRLIHRINRFKQDVNSNYHKQNYFCLVIHNRKDRTQYCSNSLTDLNNYSARL